ncbi:MAG: tetratricopeptide repeat protein [Bacteroidales bacterium]|nr:tetratricopeptide repeat protein [Bacteroidales bacterium]MBR4716104.1 tetratricopeptide repeat protein [Bacteroidales bacterium]
MKKTLLIIAASLLMIACGQDREKEIKNIEQHEIELSTIDISSDDSAAVEMVALYRKFANNFPDDSLAPAYMQRAAEISINLGQTDQAISLLDSIITLYPSYEDVAGCYFMKGYAYEVAEQIDQAREAYTYFVENYPDHYLAADTKKMINFLGMTPEDMFDAIMNLANDEGMTR